MVPKTKAVDESSGGAPEKRRREGSGIRRFSAALRPFSGPADRVLRLQIRAAPRFPEATAPGQTAQPCDPHTNAVPSGAGAVPHGGQSGGRDLRDLVPPSRSPGAPAHSPAQACHCRGPERGRGRASGPQAARTAPAPSPVPACPRGSCRFSFLHTSLSVPERTPSCPALSFPQTGAGKPQPARTRPLGHACHRAAAKPGRGREATPLATTGPSRTPATPQEGLESGSSEAARGRATRHPGSTVGQA